ncbi:FAD-binding protein [Paenibacillus sp. N1-5-1-14]|uniref:D-arabinono-1,4-lactone oxidase n=1 Tax=Paenibacillus radicibacter TaxID=2972488 RepID=UPI002158BF33|nr:D-arabinono-1,4-lactone oxidase [Paenibacillus radicibacter]MCR8644211.1 FAD-binding protein [Paenibacillus radicibacter]
MKQVANPTWRNWSRLAVSKPQQLLYPESIQDVVDIVHACRKNWTKIRIVGSGHSFPPLARTDFTLVSLDAMQGILKIDREAQTALVWAGTKLKKLGEDLFAAGWAQENLGDINAQSIGGAIGTGTHGTGVQFGSLSTQVVGLTVVTADGSVIECSEEVNPQIFKAMQLSLGTLGIIVQVRLKVIPAQRMHFQSQMASFTECMENLVKWRQEHRHFEFYWFPYTDQTQVKFMNATDLPASKNSVWNNLNKLVMENAAFWLISEGCRIFPKICQAASRLSAKAIPTMSEAGYGHQLFATLRLVRFSEMEYSVPADSMQAILEEVKATIERKQFAVHFPIECRYVRGDDIWLSPAYDRDSAYIAVHMYKGMPYKDYFTTLENIFLRHGGRPHWGKLHSLRESELNRLYPKFEDFLEVRRILDPDGLFSNDYVSGLFG